MRKIIQVAGLPDGAILALCDDGTVWVNSGGYWLDVTPIPQHPIPEVFEPKGTL